MNKYIQNYDIIICFALHVHIMLGTVIYRKGINLNVQLQHQEQKMLSKAII